MMVGVEIVDLVIDGCQSLKAKRHILKSLKDRVRNTFNVSITELDDQDLWQRSKLGITCGACDRAGIDAILNRVDDFITREHAVTVIDTAREIR